MTLRDFGRARSTPFFFVACALAGIGGGCTADETALDWDTWEQIPVFGDRRAKPPFEDDARVKPLDTLARFVVRKVCGKESPWLSPAGALAQGENESALGEARKLFPGGKPRKFRASEILFSWMVEADKWDRVPFLPAMNEELRRDLLGLPLTDKEGNRLKHASPWQVAHAKKLEARRAELAKKQQAARAEGKPFELTGADEKLAELLDAHNLFLALASPPTESEEGRDLFFRRFRNMVHLWTGLENGFFALSRSESAAGVSAPLAAAAEAVRGLTGLARGGETYAGKIEPGLVAFRQSTETLRRQLEDCRSRAEKRLRQCEEGIAKSRQHLRQLQQSPERVPPIEFNQRAAEASQVVQELEHEKVRAENVLIESRKLALAAGELAGLAEETQMALYDHDFWPAVVPALHPSALQQGRGLDREVQKWLFRLARSDEDGEGAEAEAVGRHAGNRLRPWLGLPAVLWGSDLLLKDYPQPEIEEVRRAFRELAAIYRDREAPNRAPRFSAAMDRFTLALAALGEEMEPLRRKLPIRQRDEDLLARTAYPPFGATWTEVHYNRLDPFLWTWALSLAAFVAFLGAVGPARKPSFWLGTGLLAAGQLMTIYGFALRTLITGYTPVATMFETVIFVALVVALLGLWLALVPLFGRGLQLAWQWTAIPCTWEASPQREPRSAAAAPWLHVVRLLLVSARAALVAVVFYYLAVCPYGAGKGEPAVLLRPRVGIGASWPSLGEGLIWIVGLTLLALSLYYLPRLLLSIVVALVTVPRVLGKGGLSEPLQQAIARRPFALCGAAVAFLAGYVGYYAPIFKQDIKALEPVLRHNFWLTSHVLTITASYGAGALAWALGNVALGYYLLGRYRDPKRGSPAAAPGKLSSQGDSFEAPEDFAVRCAPEECATVATYIYKATQVAVVLLFVGTVLGAAWADVAWGRYWGWDPKEVWALVSLLVYLVVLHGRHTGWSGNFGLAMGSVIGATSIMMAWYGVNYVLGTGKHTYGTGAGGLKWVLLAVAVNWILVGAAAFRYLIETRPRERK